jgi:hypothetical protein
MKRKTLQGVDIDVCKLVEALLVTTLHPFSSLGLPHCVDLVALFNY